MCQIARTRMLRSASLSLSPHTNTHTNTHTSAVTCNQALLQLFDWAGVTPWVDLTRRDGDGNIMCTTENVPGMTCSPAQEEVCFVCVCVCVRVFVGDGGEGGWEWGSSSHHHVSTGDILAVLHDHLLLDRVVVCVDRARLLAQQPREPGRRLHLEGRAEGGGA